MHKIIAKYNIALVIGMLFYPVNLRNAVYLIYPVWEINYLDPQQLNTHMYSTLGCCSHPINLKILSWQLLPLLNLEASHKNLFGQVS